MDKGIDRDVHMMDGAASALCTACGLCCDGTLFQAVKVGSDERARLERAGLPIENGVQPTFRLRCTMLAGTCCAIYADRPAICRTFVCALLRQLYRNNVSIDRAGQIVETARTLRDKVAAATAPGQSVAAALGADAQIEWRSTDDPDARRTAAVRDLDRIALNMFLDRHFRIANSAAPPETAR